MALLFPGASFGGSAGVVNNVIGDPTLDADTTYYVDFDGNGTDQEGGSNVVTSPLAYAPVNPVGGARQGLYKATSSGSINGGNGNAGSLTQGAVTVAFFFAPLDIQSGNNPIIGYKLAGGAGDPNDYNFPWVVDLQAAGNIRWLWQTANKDNQEVISDSTLSEGAMYHIVCTRTADATAGEIYINGVLDGSETGLTAPNGGSSQTSLILLGSVPGILCSTIIKDVHVDAAGALALYEDSLA